MKGYGIFVGVNYVEGQHYESNKPLDRAYKNAKSFCDFARRDNWYEQIEFITGKRATWKNIKKRLDQYASLSQTEEGYLLITFSGHGLNLEKRDNKKDKDNWQFLCFYDRMVLEYEIRESLTQFSNKFKIILIVDSCYSGGIIEPQHALIKTMALTTMPILPQNAYYKNKSFYSKLLDRYLFVNPKIPPTFDADLFYYASSKKDKPSILGTNTELTFYSEYLLAILDSTSFQGNYFELQHLLNNVLANMVEPAYWVDQRSTGTFFRDTVAFNPYKKAESLKMMVSDWIIKTNELSDVLVTAMIKYPTIPYKATTVTPSFLYDHMEEGACKEYLKMNEIKAEIVSIIYVEMSSKSKNNSLEITFTNLVGVDQMQKSNGVILIYDFRHQQVLDHQLTKGKIKLYNN
ncbi:MAG: hypothetical protein CL840_18930 [Crocinitomicaceae bacterium]|nr:hypothetical protein [Crocinitomicaceae bacterium]|tara:strand:- start:7452 stop:8663 length:1212 start_codon:yes stop_codon:yes gene_type:complete